METKFEINEKLKEMRNFHEINKPTTLSQTFAKIKKIVGDQGIDLLRILEDHDKTKAGKYYMQNSIF